MLVRGGCAGALAGVLAATPASAQPARAPAPATVPAPAPAPAPTSAPVPDMTAAVPGGVTAEQVGTRAVATSYQARAAEEQLRAAEARTDLAWVDFLPRIVGIGRYTRLSNFTPPSLVGSGGALVGTTAAPNTPNPSPTFALDTSVFALPLVLNNYLLQATIAIPISDYFLRFNEQYTASTRSEEAAHYDVATARARSYADGKIAYFTWLRARGALVVAQQSLAVARAHLKDAENQFAVGNASKADVLRAQTQVSAAELGVERGKSGVAIAERQVRIAMHAKDEERLEPGESIDGPLAPAPANVAPLVSEAHANRPEIKSIDKNAEAQRRFASAARASRWPGLSGFGDVTYANPNARRFPQTQDWFPTWSVGAQVTWTLNEVVSAGPNSADAEARAAALEAQRSATRDGVELEVTQAYQGMLEADTAISTTARQLESALEAYRVARELFNNGRGTATTLVDAETALAQARFDHLNARVDARIARIRLEHALGRDAKDRTP